MRDFKHLTLSALVFLSFFNLTYAQETQSFTMEEAIGYAMQNSTAIKNAKLNINDADAQIIERRSIGLPQIGGTVDYQYFYKVPVVQLAEAFAPNATPEERQVSFQLRHNFTAGLSLNSLIFDGSYLVGLKAARLYKDYVNQDLIAIQQGVRNDVSAAYLPSLILAESLSLLDKNISNLEKLLFETKESYKAGFVEQLDVDRLELSLANLQTEKETLERQYQIAVDALKFAISYPVEEVLIIEDDITALLIDATEEDLTKVMSYYDRAEYKVAETGIKLNELNIEQFRAGYLPNVVGFISYQQGFQGNKLNSTGFWAPTGVLGATINIPIYDGGSKKAKIERARIQLKQAQNQIFDLERAINIEVKNSRANYFNAKSRVASQKKNLDLAQRIYDTTQIKYKEGVGSSLEINNAEQSLYTSQQNYMQALYDLLVAKTELNKALGK